jgi:molybdate-binding protein
MAPKFLSFLSNKFQLLSAIASSSGAGDADKIVATDSGGKISRSFLNRIVAVTSSSNLTAVNADTTDIATITLTENTTFSNPTGTPFDGQLLLYRIVKVRVVTRLLSALISSQLARSRIHLQLLAGISSMK